MPSPSKWLRAADAQRSFPLSVAAGTTVREAIRLRGLASRYLEVDAEDGPVGHTRAHRCGERQAAKDGDRVEIYRPLAIDPKQARRRRASRARC